MSEDKTEKTQSTRKISQTPTPDVRQACGAEDVPPDSASVVEPQKAATANDTAGEAVEQAPGDAADTVEQLEQESKTETETEALHRQRDEIESRFLRVSADYQNYVRRAQQNISTAREQLLIDVAKSLVTVLDHFDRALEVDPEKTSSSDLLAGMQIVRDELLKTLEVHGVRRLEAKRGDEFDPTRHEGLMRQVVKGIAPDHVARQLQPGYTLGEKTLRPAQVSLTE